MFFCLKKNTNTTVASFASRLINTPSSFSIKNNANSFESGVYFKYRRLTSVARRCLPQSTVATVSWQTALCRCRALAPTHCFEKRNNSVSFNCSSQRNKKTKTNYSYATKSDGCTRAFNLSQTNDTNMASSYRKIHFFYISFSLFFEKFKS